MEYFGEVIGQGKVKEKLGFYINFYKKNQVLPHFLMVAQKGDGKTMMSVLFAQHLHQIRPNKQFAPVFNASMIDGIDYFWGNVMLPYVANGNFTILIDEASELPREVMFLLLTALQPNKQHRNTVTHLGVDVEVDFSRTTFIFATTDPQKLTNAFKDRLKIISLQQYSQNEIKEILARKLDEHQILASPPALDKITSYIKHNGRAATLLADDIIRYCELHSQKNFMDMDCEDFIKIHDMHLHGLDQNDIAVLRALTRERYVKLMDISSITGLERGAIQNEFENNLIKHNLMGRDSKGRYITKKGKDYLERLL